MVFKILVDENIPNSVIKQLRGKDFEIVAIREEGKGIKDENVIKLSKDKQLPILTMDKDFGYLTFHQKLIPYGVILLRINPQSPNIIYSTILQVFDLLQKQNIVLKNRFIVSDGRTLRIRKY